MKEGKRERIDAQITQIKQKLDRGTETIKEGYRIPGLNPEGKKVKLPLSEEKEGRLWWNLKVLEFRRDNDWSGKYMRLPEWLRDTNPNKPRYTDMGKIFP